MGVFNNITTTITGSTSNLFSETTNLVSEITPLITVGLGIYIILQAYHYYNKGLDENILDISRRMVGWFLIAAFCLNAGNYIEIAEIIMQAPDALASAVSGNEFTPNALDQNLTKTDNIFKGLNEKIGEFPVEEGFKALFAMIMVGLMQVCCWVFEAIVFGYYIVAKISLAAILMVGPLFIGCLFFPATRQWGMNWINQCFNYIIVITLFVVLGMIQQNAFEQIVLTCFNVFDGVNPVKGLFRTTIPVAKFMVALLAAFPTVVVTLLVFIIAAKQVPAIAAALSGNSVQTSNMFSNLAAYAVGKMAGKMGLKNSMKEGGK